MIIIFQTKNTGTNISCHGGPITKKVTDFSSEPTNLFKIWSGVGGYNGACSNSSNELYFDGITSNTMQIMPYTLSHTHQVLPISSSHNYVDLMNPSGAMGVSHTLTMKHINALKDIGWDIMPYEGVGDYVQIKSSSCSGTPPQVFTLGTANNYCLYSSTTMNYSTGTWKLNLYADDGIHEVATQSGLSSWNISLSSLPSGHVWHRDINGKVSGILSYYGQDMDGIWHKDMLSVAVNYMPQNLIVGGQNTSVSGHCDKYTVSFYAPGAASYVIKYRYNNGSWSGWATAATPTYEALKYEFTGLNESLLYEFKVEAVNSYGTITSNIISRPPCCYDINSLPTITGTEVWTPTSNPAYTGTPVSDITMGADIVIAGGGSLKLSGVTLKMAGSRQIIVQAGAGTSGAGGRLILENAKIMANTGGCDPAVGMWKGVQVMGNAAQPQGATVATTTQGYIKMVNSEIADATVAISLGTGTAAGDGGGIVQAYGSSFRNNRASVVFQPYHNYTSSTLMSNISTFNGCTFVWDAAYQGSALSLAPGTHAKLTEVEGVSFTGCNFLNRDVSSSLKGKGTGIHGVNSGFTVFPSTPYIWAVTNSRFCGFTNGILVQGTFDNPTISVDRANFDSTSIGVNVAVHNQVAVTRCNFKIGNGLAVAEISSPEFLGCKQNIGILTSNTESFKIENNNFIGRPNTNTVWYNIGTAAVNCGHHLKKVFNCKFDSLVRGVVSLGNNTPPVGAAGGLTVLCSSFDKNNADIHIARQTGGTAYQGMVTGIPLGAYSVAGNTFANSTTNIINNGRYDLFYTYDAANTTTEKPAVNAGVRPVITFGDNIAKSCPAHYTGTSISVTGLNTQTYVQLNNQFNSRVITRAQTLATLSNLIDRGNSVAMGLYIDTVTNADSLYGALTSISPYVSSGSLRKMIESGILSYSQEFDVLTLNPDAIKKDSLFSDMIAYFDDAYANSNPQIPNYSAQMLQAVAAKTQRTQLENTIVSSEVLISENFDRTMLGVHAATNINVDVNDTTGGGINTDSSSLYFLLDSNSTYNRHDSTDVWLQKINDPWTAYARIMYYYQKADYENADEIFTNINTQLLTTDEVAYYDTFATVWNVLKTASEEVNGERKFYDLTTQELAGLSYGGNPTITSNPSKMFIKVIKTWSTGPDVLTIDWLCENEYSAEKKRATIKYPFTEYGKDAIHNNVKVYPNPASMMLYFEYTTSAKATIRITDVTGRLIDQQVIKDAGRAAIDVKGYAPGVYMYQITTATATHTGKVVIGN